MINHFIVVTSILSIEYKWVAVQKTIIEALHKLSAFMSEYIKLKCLLQSSDQMEAYVEKKAGIASAHEHANFALQ